MREYYKMTLEVLNLSNLMDDHNNKFCSFLMKRHQIHMLKFLNRFWRRITIGFTKYLIRCLVTEERCSGGCFVRAIHLKLHQNSNCRIMRMTVTLPYSGYLLSGTEMHYIYPHMCDLPTCIDVLPSLVIERFASDD